LEPKQEQKMAKYLLSLLEFEVEREFRTPATISVGDSMTIMFGDCDHDFTVRRVMHKVDRGFVQIHLDAEPYDGTQQEIRKELLKEGWSNWGETPLEYSS